MWVLGTVVSHQGLEMFLARLWGYISAKRGNLNGGTWETFSPDIMAPGAYDFGLQADITTYILTWKSCAPAGTICGKGLVWSDSGLCWDGGLHTALPLSILHPHQLGTSTKPQLCCYRAPMWGPYKDQVVLFCLPLFLHLFICFYRIISYVAS